MKKMEKMEKMGNKGADNIFSKCIEKYPTPFYLFDLEAFSDRVKAIQEKLGERVGICFAVKANPFLIQRAGICADRLEVCSPGEFAICEKSKVEMDKVVLSGVYKEAKEIRRVMELYGSQIIYTVESPSQFELLVQESSRLGIRIRILLRLTSRNQFGMDEEQIERLISSAAQYPSIFIEGLQFYSGTQKKRRFMKDELEHIDEFLISLRERYGFEAEELEYGPGLFVPYFEKDEHPSMEEELEALRQLLDHMKFKGRITLEMGRYLAAACGYYFTRIVDVKENKDVRYAIVDGGIHQLNYYGQTMAMKLPDYRQIKRGENISHKISNVTVCGSLCTSQDVLVRNLPLRGEDILGDVLVFANTGAYSVTEGISLFLSRALPLVLCQTESGNIQLVRDRIETSCLNGAYIQN